MSQLGAFCQSKLGQFYQSPLGARGCPSGYTVYAAIQNSSGDNTIIALDGTDGTLLWTSDVLPADVATGAGDGGYLYFGASTELFKLDRRDGTIIWTATSHYPHSQFGSLDAHAGYLFWDRQRVDVGDGSIIWRANYDGSYYGKYWGACCWNGEVIQHYVDGQYGNFIKLDSDAKKLWVHQQNFGGHTAAGSQFVPNYQDRPQRAANLMGVTITYTSNAHPRGDPRLYELDFEEVGYYQSEIYPDNSCYNGNSTGCSRGDSHYWQRQNLIVPEGQPCYEGTRKFVGGGGPVVLSSPSGENTTLRLPWAYSEALFGYRQINGGPVIVRTHGDMSVHDWEYPVASVNEIVVMQP